MAVRFCSAPSLTTQGSMPIRKPVNKILMVAQSQSSVKNTSLPQIISSPIRNKIFEDQSRGIVCYKDDNGEITCEGYDEGPRPTSNYQGRPRPHGYPSRDYRARDAEVIDLLRRNWLLIEGGGKGFNLNGFNTLC